MANSWNGPQLGSPIRTDVPELQKKLIALLKGDPTSVADIPSGAKRLVNTSGVQWQVQQYNGSSWAAIGKLMHDVDKLDGYHAAITPAANTVAVRNADKKLEGDITGNAATASSAATLSETLPVSKGGTGATTSAAARTNLGVPPTSHAASSTAYGLATNANYGHVRSDGDTTSIVAGEVVVTDVAIDGKTSDLARNRGQIGKCYSLTSSIDFNTLFKAGRYWINNARFDGSSNKPPATVGGFCDVLCNEAGGNYTKQIYHEYNKPVIYIREHGETDSGWSENWTKIITEKNLATASTPGLVKPGNGMTVDAAGSLNVDTSNASTPGIVKSSTTALAGAVPLADSNGKLDESWVPTPPVTLVNTRITITESNAAWTPPVTGWARVTVIGGGGGGAGGSGDSEAAVGGGGGGSGDSITDYVYLSGNAAVTIGAGGSGGAVGNIGRDGGKSKFTLGNKSLEAYGGKGGGLSLNLPYSLASSGKAGGMWGINGNPGNVDALGVSGYGNVGGGGNGGGYAAGYAGYKSGFQHLTAYSATGYGSGGAGGSGGRDLASVNRKPGSNGAAGVVIIEYYDPDKEVA